MASTSTTAASPPAPKKTSKPKPTIGQVAERGRALREARTKVSKPRVLFVPGSLNDRISKLELNESMAHVLRIPVAPTSGATLSSQAQAFWRSKNSVLSGGIAKVRSAAEHSSKRFTMERGSYMTASNDAMFTFVTITRTA